MKRCIKALSLFAVVLMAVFTLTISVFAACSVECDMYLRDTLSTPTCTKTGTEKWMCSVCGTSEYRYPAALGHDMYLHDTLSTPTCTKTGTEKWLCKTCGEVEYRYPAATGHSMGVRTYCSQTVYCVNSGCDYKEVGSCFFGAWRVTVQPSCTKSGTKTRTCTNCETIETGVISELGHSYGSWKIETKAECEVEGYQVRSCGTCGDTQYAVISASGHSYGSWQTVTAASCKSLGEQRRVCSECGKTETKSIAALDHKYVNNVCSVCGDDKTDETTKAPDETTKGPDETTKVPDETTKAPDETTSTPVKDHEHNWSAWQKVDANKHSRSCQDSDCSAKETKSHEDKDTDGKCDVCDGMYLTEVPIEKILGAVLGVALVLGVIYMISVIIKKSKE